MTSKQFGEIVANLLGFIVMSIFWYNFGIEKVMCFFVTMYLFREMWIKAGHGNAST